MIRGRVARAFTPATRWKKGTTSFPIYWRCGAKEQLTFETARVAHKAWVRNMKTHGGIRKSCPIHGEVCEIVIKVERCEKCQEHQERKFCSLCGGCIHQCERAKGERRGSCALILSRQPSGKGKHGHRRGRPPKIKKDAPA